MTKLLIDKAKTYRTRDGSEVRIYDIFVEGQYPVHGSVKDPKTGHWRVIEWTLNGEYNPRWESGFDLVEVKSRIKRTVYINYYNNGSFGFAHSTLYEANFISDSSAIRTACITVNLDFEEGEGL
jgi:hypothetical protein